jgi:hypothetical protein
MNDESREELLSAYLDDELSAEERARVEAWLAEDAEFQRLYEELSSLRTELQSLPRHTLHEDLGPAVLRGAEQIVLDGKQAAAKVGLAPSSSSATSQWWSRRSGRMFLWPVVAVAAALLVALFNTQQNPREVARDDADFKDTALRNGQMESVETDGYVATGESEALAMPGAESTPLETAPSLRSAAMPNELADTPIEPRSEGRADESFAMPLSAEKSQIRDSALMRGAAPTAALKRQGDVAQGNFFLDAKVETNIKRALENRGQVNLIQCDVTPAFLNDNPLEQVLSGNKIAYQRFAIPQTDTKTNRAIRSQSELDPDDNLGYACEATPEQVEIIVNDLVKEQNRRRVSNLVIGLQEPTDEAQGDVSEKLAAERLRSLEEQQEQQPVTIYLRKQAVEQQAAPVQRAPASAPAEP